MLISLTATAIDYKNLVASKSITIESERIIDLVVNVNTHITGNAELVYEDMNGTRTVYHTNETKAYITALTQAATVNYDDSYEDVTTHGAAVPLSVVKTTSLITPDAGGDGYTLADGVEGQVKYIAVKAAVGVAVITPTNLLGYTTITFAATAGLGISLKFIDGNWTCIGNNGAVLA